MSINGSSSSVEARPKVNLRSTAVKRIMQEAAELADANDTANDDFVAAPLEVSGDESNRRPISDELFGGMS